MPEKRKLLLVDDDSLIIDLLKNVLASPAWEIATASDALQALMKARELRPFLIVSDVQMPAFGKGTDFLRALRMEKATAATPVIMLTGMELDRVRPLVSADEKRVRFFNKPPDHELLYAAIQELTGVDGRVTT